jgi:hypothetical protein
MVAGVVGLAACLAGLEPPVDPFTALSPGWIALQPGDSAQLKLVTASGDTVPGGDVAWSTSVPGVVAISATGVVTGEAFGEVRVRAAVPGVSTAMATVIVAPPVLVGAGDIGDCGSIGPGATAALINNIPGVVFAAGDNAYPDGTVLDYEYCYEPTWGSHRARTRPTPGNHEYHTPGATGYFRYFGANAGERHGGYYSYALGTWHVVALNTSVPFMTGSAQEAWLLNDLGTHPSLCTVAYWHHPRFSSGPSGNDPRLASLWQELVDGGVDVVIAAHDHHYERFAPQLADGTADAGAGIRQFIVGTGGGITFPLAAIAPNSEVRITDTFGVLKLELDSASYTWQFLRAPGGAVLDSGTTVCH